MVEEKWKTVPVWADNHHRYFKWVGNFYVVCNEVWLLWWLCHMAPVSCLPCSSCQPSPTSVELTCFSSTTPLLGRRKVWIPEGKETGRWNWKTVNRVNSSVQKFCKALITQDDASYHNHTNTIFLTLLLRKIFSLLVGFCCTEWGKSCLTEGQQIQICLY